MICTHLTHSLLRAAKSRLVGPASRILPSAYTISPSPRQFQLPAFPWQCASDPKFDPRPSLFQILLIPLNPVTEFRLFAPRSLPFNILSKNILLFALCSSLPPKVSHLSLKRCMRASRINETGALCAYPIFKTSKNREKSKENARLLPENAHTLSKRCLLSAYSMPGHVCPN